MRYATWTLDFAADQHNGTGPEAQAAELGLDMIGRFLQGDTFDGFISGEVHGDGSFDMLSPWNVQEIAPSEYLLIAQQTEPATTLDAEGNLVYPERTLEPDEA